ncbi:MAG: nucleotidyl transferase AbiEii/AbiGii toxin family protein [Elusimicrobiota bacterium]|nr:nucleotidyl transferase AbiEii/AbiGii toxin family protein [Elusimicrobiota bacterium]
MDINYTGLQIREIFHIEFLRAFARKFKPAFYALKGGVNMRLYFKSIRYSEDMDLDVNTVDIITLRDAVMKIITSVYFTNELKPFGIEEIRPPDIKKAKQTSTTQRFKIHLITHGNEDLFTKIEFSRRKNSGNSVAEFVSANVLRPYKVSPLIISHYDINTAVVQKINALAGRNIVQARDIFDIYTLLTQYTVKNDDGIDISLKISKTACENIFSVGFRQFRDTVLSYLTEEDRTPYNNPDIWDELKLKVHEFICQKTR